MMVPVAPCPLFTASRSKFSRLGPAGPADCVQAPRFALRPGRAIRALSRYRRASRDRARAMPRQRSPWTMWN